MPLIARATVVNDSDEQITLEPGEEFEASVFMAGGVCEIRRVHDDQIESGDDENE